MDDLLSVANFLRKQLADFEQKIKETKGLTTDEIKRHMAEKDEDFMWKSFVMKPYGVVDNILKLLDDCYETFVELIQDNSNDDPTMFIGALHSTGWKKFQLRVIEQLLHPKNYDMTHDFEDTASGCDELVWNVAYDIIMDKLSQ